MEDTKQDVVNVEVYRASVDVLASDVLTTDRSIALVRVDSTEVLKIEDYHAQDCCESVYADRESMRPYIPGIIGKQVDLVVIKRVPKMGVLICLEGTGLNPIKVFIPCYNVQNGYYSDDLELIITTSGQKVTVNISDCVEDNIN